MTTTCFIPVLGKRLRATVLDSCGAVTAAGTEGATLATDGFISIALSSEVEDGTEIITRKASGALCVNEKAADSFKRFTVEMEFCGVNPSLLGIVSNATPYLDYAGNVSGFTIAEGTMTKKFALELWTGLSGQACAPGSEASGYMLLPYLQAGVLGDITIDGENAVTFSMTGAFTKGGNAWGAGAYNVVNSGATASVLPLALDPDDHLLLMDTNLAPPPSACDPVPMTPYIYSLTPATGPAAGNTSIYLTGSGFTGATAVQFGGTPGTAFSVVSDTRINVTTPAKTAAPYTVTVVRPTTNITKANGFTYT